MRRSNCRPPACSLTAAFPTGSLCDQGIIITGAERIGKQIKDKTLNGESGPAPVGHWDRRSEEHTSELQSLMRISYAVFCLKKNTKRIRTNTTYIQYY